jgi:hypothetical protein
MFLVFFSAMNAFHQSATKALPFRQVKGAIIV